MRNFLLFGFMIFLFGCSQTVSTKEDFSLTELQKEPNNCEFLYKITSKSTVYSEEAAKKYLKETIHTQDTFGDSYFIVNKDIIHNDEAIFGPKNTYSFKANVYKCKK
ncbi:MAG: hypothetical protein MJ156_00020 [Alphaproteobacteria bacterium]|nr:hypothetical protein [Alphaproteobacteria bacterium]